MQHLRGRIAKSDVPRTYVRTYVRTHVRTYVPTHPALCLGTSVPRQKNHRLHDKWWSLIRIPVKSVWSASLPITPYRGVLNRLSIAHCKALGESCLLSHKSSSWGVVGRSYGRQKKMANGTMKMVKASLKRDPGNIK